MATSLTWTDEIGAATLVNGLPAPADRFAGWTPFRRPVGPRAHALGTGLPYKYRLRTDYGARFRLEYIKPTRHELVMRLIDHLENGGVVTVNTGDAAGRSYAACYVAEGFDLSGALEQSDRRTIEYTLTLELINSGAADMLCLYDGGSVVS